MGSLWPARLLPQAAETAAKPPAHVVGMLRDVLDIAGRDRWIWPPAAAGDVEGEDVRAASVGRLTAVRWINRAAGRLYVVCVVWLGWAATPTGTTGPAGPRAARTDRH